MAEILARIIEMEKAPGRGNRQGMGFVQTGSGNNKGFELWYRDSSDDLHRIAGSRSALNIEADFADRNMENGLNVFRNLRSVKNFSGGWHGGFSQQPPVVNPPAGQGPGGDRGNNTHEDWKGMERYGSGNCQFICPLNTNALLVTSNEIGNSRKEYTGVFWITNGKVYKIGGQVSKQPIFAEYENWLIIRGNAPATPGPGSQTVVAPIDYTIYLPVKNETFEDYHTIGVRFQLEDESTLNWFPAEAGIDGDFKRFTPTNIDDEGNSIRVQPIFGWSSNSQPSRTIPQYIKLSAERAWGEIKFFLGTYPNEDFWEVTFNYGSGTRLEAIPATGGAYKPKLFYTAVNHTAEDKNFEDFFIFKMINRGTEAAPKFDVFIEATEALRNKESTAGIAYDQWWSFIQVHNSRNELIDVESFAMEALYSLPTGTVIIGEGKTLKSGGGNPSVGENKLNASDGKGGWRDTNWEVLENEGWTNGFLFSRTRVILLGGDDTPLSGTFSSDMLSLSRGTAVNPFVVDHTVVRIGNNLNSGLVHACFSSRAKADDNSPADIKTAGGGLLTLDINGGFRIQPMSGFTNGSGLGLNVDGLFWSSGNTPITAEIKPKNIKIGSSGSIDFQAYVGDNNGGATHSRAFKFMCQDGTTSQALTSEALTINAQSSSATNRPYGVFARANRQVEGTPYYSESYVPAADELITKSYADRTYSTSTIAIPGTTFGQFLARSNDTTMLALPLIQTDSSGGSDFITNPARFGLGTTTATSGTNTYARQLTLEASNFRAQLTFPAAWYTDTTQTGNLRLLLFRITDQNTSTSTNVFHLEPCRNTSGARSWRPVVENTNQITYAPLAKELVTREYVDSVAGGGVKTRQWINLANQTASSINVSLNPPTSGYTFSSTSTVSYTFEGNFRDDLVITPINTGTQVQLRMRHLQTAQIGTVQVWVNVMWN